MARFVAITTSSPASRRSASDRPVSKPASSAAQRGGQREPREQRPARTRRQRSGAGVAQRARPRRCAPSAPAAPAGRAGSRLSDEAGRTRAPAASPQIATTAIATASSTWANTIAASAAAASKPKRKTSGRNTANRDLQTGARGAPECRRRARDDHRDAGLRLAEVAVRRRSTTTRTTLSRPQRQDDLFEAE